MISYKELISKLPNGRKPTYQQLLLTFEWKTFKDNIIKEQSEKCQECNAEVLRKMTSEEFQIIQNLIEAERLTNPYIYLLDKVGTDPELYEKMKIDNNPPALTEYVKSDPPVTLELHHKDYLLGALPWEYPAIWLETLCSDCHHKRHFGDDGRILKRQKVYIDKKKEKLANLPACDRCGGKGYFPEYSHVQRGVCFSCGGSGMNSLW